MNYDFVSDRGRDKVAREFNWIAKLVATQYAEKFPRHREELFSEASVGLVLAMNTYDPAKCDDFGAWARYRIEKTICDYLKQYGHSVHVPYSAQRKSLAETGEYIRITTCSGDARISDDKNSKTWFDIYATRGAATDETVLYLMNEFREAMMKIFPENLRDVNIFVDAFGLTGDEYLKGIEIADKYGMSKANVTRVKDNMLERVKRNEQLMDIARELLIVSTTADPYDLAA